MHCVVAEVQYIAELKSEVPVCKVYFQLGTSLARLTSGILKLGWFSGTKYCKKQYIWNLPFQKHCYIDQKLLCFFEINLLWKRAYVNRRSNLASLFARINSTPHYLGIPSEWRLLFYFFSNRGVRLISLAGIDLILRVLSISPLFRKLNSWWADWLFSFFLLYELMLLIIRLISFWSSSSKEVPFGWTRRIISCVTSHPPFWSERCGSQ